MSTLNWGTHQPTLHTSTTAGRNLVLRPWRHEDTDAVLRSCQDPATIRWTSIPSPYTREHAVEFIEASTYGPWDTKAGAVFAVADEETDEVLASCGLIRGEEAHSRAEIGYWAAPAARRQGVVTAAVRCLTHWGINELGLARIIIEAAVENEASQRVALASGYIREGVQRSREQRADSRNDLVLFSFLPSDQG